MSKQKFTPQFQQCIDLIRQDYERVLVQNDTLEFLGQDSREFKQIIDKETAERKIKAYEYLFPFFVDW